MKSKERYTVKTAKEKILLHTNDLEEALKMKEENKHEGAYIDDRKSKKKHKTTFFRWFKFLSNMLAIIIPLKAIFIIQINAINFHRNAIRR